MKPKAEPMLPVSFVDIIEQELDFERCRVKMAEQIVLALRRKLRAADPTLPIEFDGTAWSLVEADYLTEGTRR